MVSCREELRGKPSSNRPSASATFPGPPPSLSKWQFMGYWKRRNGTQGPCLGKVGSEKRAWWKEGRGDQAHIHLLHTLAYLFSENLKHTRNSENAYSWNYFTKSSRPGGESITIPQWQLIQNPFQIDLENGQSGMAGFRHSLIQISDNVRKTQSLLHITQLLLLVVFILRWVLSLGG